MKWTDTVEKIEKRGLQGVVVTVAGDEYAIDTKKTLLDIGISIARPVSETTSRPQLDLMAVNPLPADLQHLDGTRFPGATDHPVIVYLARITWNSGPVPEEIPTLDEALKALPFMEDWPLPVWYPQEEIPA